MLTTQRRHPISPRASRGESYRLPPEPRDIHAEETSLFQPASSIRTAKLAYFCWTHQRPWFYFTGSSATNLLFRGVSMTRFLILYNKPDDAHAFESHYHDTH